MGWQNATGGWSRHGKSTEKRAAVALQNATYSWLLFRKYCVIANISDVHRTLASAEPKRRVDVPSFLPLSDGGAERTGTIAVLGTLGKWHAARANIVSNFSAFLWLQIPEAFLTLRITTAADLGP